MIELVMHTVKNDMVIHTEKSGMMRLMVEIDIDGMIADVVDKIFISLKSSENLKWKSRSDSPFLSLHSLQLSAREVDHSQQIQGSFVHVICSTYTASFCFSMNHTCPSPTLVDDCQHPIESLSQQDLSF
nr:hypothetical protein [Tanacetum cinerariifolium]